MATVNSKYSLQRLGAVVALGLLLVVLIVVKLTNIQWIEGKHYRKLAQLKMIDTVTVVAKQGNIYSSDGSLLATSVPYYELYFDALAIEKDTDFNKRMVEPADSLDIIFDKPRGYFETKLKKARANKNRGLLLADKVDFRTLKRIKNLPTFNSAKYISGLIVKDTFERRHPMGKIAERTIGYEKFVNHQDDRDKKRSVGIEGAFSNYLNGKNGKRIVQKIAKGHWKPVGTENQIEPIDGYDVVSSINVYMQDIAHHALLESLTKFEAEYGCVVVMEVKTGYIRAIANLGRAKDGNYYEQVNYAIRDAYEPGSTFKTASLMALLEDGRADTSSVFNSNGGEIIIHNRKIEDSDKGGYGTISLARGLAVSSNTVIVQAVHTNYKNNPKLFLEKINQFGLNDALNLPIRGEGKVYIPKPGDKGWSALALPWMAYGYGISMTPMHVLTFYNAIANNGEMIKPLFVEEIRSMDKVVKKYDKEVMRTQIASDGTLKKIKKALENVVKYGTAKELYDKNFSMAGKTGTAKIYENGTYDSGLYSSSFAGFFPAQNPEYTCIVVVRKPNPKKGKYGADIAGPVFKRIAQKIYTDSPTHNEVKNINRKIASQEKSYAQYIDKVNKPTQTMPNVKGMNGMDAVALLENLGLKTTVTGVGKVVEQSLDAGLPFRKTQYVNLKLK